MTTVDPIQAAIEAARAAATQVVAQNAAASVPAVTTPAAAPAVATPRGAPVSMADLMVGSMSVDAWLKVKEFGLLIGGDKTLLPNITVDLDMTAVAPCYAIKFGKNPAVYYKTYDRVSCASGGSWADACLRAQKGDPTAREYRTADLPFTVVDDIKTPDGSKVLAAKGMRLGHSLSTTNWKNWESFYRDLASKGLQAATVRVKLGFEVRTANNNTWGVVTFEHIPAA